MIYSNLTGLSCSFAGRWLLGFTALAALHTRLSCCASDTSLYEVTKGLRYTQTNSSQPSLDAANGFPFDANVFPAVQGFITNAYVKIPGSNVFTQLPLDTAQTHFELKHTKNTLKTLNNSFPSGTYQFAIYGVHDGAVLASLFLQGDLYPTTPHLANFTALQAVNANGYSTIGWDTSSSGTKPNFLRLTVEDASKNQLFQSPNVDKPGPWNGLVTNAILGPGILATGQTYTVRLNFQNNTVVDLTSHPGAMGVAGYSVETSSSLVTSSAAAPDVKVVEVAKGTQWSQTNSGPPVPSPAGQYNLTASAKSYLTGVLTNGTVILPFATNSTRNLALQTDLQTISLQGAASTAATLDAAYGNGNFTLNFTAPHDGAKSLLLPLQSVTNAPPTPHVSNFAALQQANASQAAPVTWDSWSGATPSDFIHLHIEDLQGNKIYETADIGKQTALNGIVTNASIPAGTLFPGQTYAATLTFQRNFSLNTTNYPAVLCLADYYAKTAFTIVPAPADVSTFAVCKGALFTQTGSGAPVPAPTNGYVFTAQVLAHAAASVLGGSAITPLAVTKTLALQPDGLTWSFTDYASTGAALDATYPFGTYTMQLNCAHDGQKNLSLALWTPGYPNPPHLTAFGSAQAINASADFTLAWDPFVSPGANAFIQLTILNLNGIALFQTPSFGSPGALSGSATQVTIPNGTLAPNKFYLATLFFQRFQLTDALSYPGALGLAAMSVTTQFKLGTQGPGNPPVLALPTIAPNRLFQLTAHVVPQQSYRLDGSPTLPPQWTPLLTNTAASGTLVLQDPNSPGQPRFFYRLVLLP